MLFYSAANARCKQCSSATQLITYPDAREMWFLSFDGRDNGHYVVGLVELYNIFAMQVTYLFRKTEFTIMFIVPKAIMWDKFSTDNMVLSKVGFVKHVLYSCNSFHCRQCSLAHQQRICSNMPTLLKPVLATRTSSNIMVLGMPNRRVSDLPEYLRHWWNEVYFSSIAVTFSRLYFLFLWYSS